MAVTPLYKSHISTIVYKRSHTLNRSYGSVFFVQVAIYNPYKPKEAVSKNFDTASLFLIIAGKNLT